MMVHAMSCKTISWRWFLSLFVYLPPFRSYWTATLEKTGVDFTRGLLGRIRRIAASERESKEAANGPLDLTRGRSEGDNSFEVYGGAIFDTNAFLHGMDDGISGALDLFSMSVKREFPVSYFLYPPTVLLLDPWGCLYRSWVLSFSFIYPILPILTYPHKNEINLLGGSDLFSDIQPWWNWATRYDLLQSKIPRPVLDAIRDDGGMPEGSSSSLVFLRQVGT